MVQLQWFTITIFILNIYMTSWTLLESYRKNRWCFYFSGPGRRSSHGANAERHAQATPLPRRPSRGRPSCRSRGGWRPARRGAARTRLLWVRDPRLVNGGIWSFGNIPWLFQILEMVILDDFGGSRPIFGKHISIRIYIYITTSLGNISDW